MSYSKVKKNAKSTNMVYSSLVGGPKEEEEKNSCRGQIMLFGRKTLAIEAISKVTIPI